MTIWKLPMRSDSVLIISDGIKTEGANARLSLIHCHVSKLRKKQKALSGKRYEIEMKAAIQAASNPAADGFSISNRLCRKIDLLDGKVMAIEKSIRECKRFKRVMIESAKKRHNRSGTKRFYADP